jgi:hypothetical protein
MRSQESRPRIAGPFISTFTAPLEDGAETPLAIAINSYLPYGLKANRGPQVAPADSGVAGDANQRQGLCWITGKRSTDATSIRRFLICALCPGSQAPKYPPCSLGEGEACQTHCHVLRSIPSCARPLALTHDSLRRTWKRTSPCAIHTGHGERR